MKKVFVFLLIFLQAGCFYSDGCLFIAQRVHCVDKGPEFPYVAFFQKKETLGNTNPSTRWNDIRECGGIKISQEKNTFEIYNERDSDGFINKNVVKDFESCMLKKGYIRLESTDCGMQSPKWSTGKCNL